MKIEQGLFGRMVLQRTRAGISDAYFSGLSMLDGTVLASVMQDGKKVRGWQRKKVGNASGGKMSGRICGLPSGGPYDIILTIRAPSGKADFLNIGDVFVGDVWILAGQSNMQGIGYLKDAAGPIRQVRAFYANDQWGVARDPIHNLSEAVDQVHSDLYGGMTPKLAKHLGVGPGVAFGQEMFRRTGVPQGLIACAHGGTSMTQWDPSKKNLGSRSLYGAMLRRFRKNGCRIAGILWYQGCSETSEEGVGLYRSRMQKLVRSMRRDFGDTGLPFVAVQISRVASPSNNHLFWNRIQEEQRLLIDRIHNCSVVPSIDLDMDDSCHISGRAQNRLGGRLAQAMCALRKIKCAGKMPITLETISTRHNLLSGGMDITVTFGNVMGCLQAPGRPSGFAVGNPSPMNVIFRTEIEKNTVIVRTALSRTDTENTSLYLYYGYGLMPFCNITDSADRSLPVFGPRSLGILPRATSKFVTKMRISKAMPLPVKINRLSFPDDMKTLELKTREFSSSFCDLHMDLFKSTPDDVLVYYICDIECSELMKLSACIGYDSSIKVWIDGKAVYHDLNGSNPARPDKGLVRFAGTPGRHQILIAQSSNFGRAWGIFLRFARRDVHQKLIRAGAAHYKMPAILG